MQLLLVNQFGVMFGFYLVVPFLAVHLRDNLMLATVAVGAVLGARSLCQQGLTVLGGSAADRFGCRPVIIAGCALRAVGFGLFAVVDGLTGLLAAAVITGLAGAVFSPATRAYLAMESGEHRLPAFALFNVASSSGALSGPLVGSLLITVDFRWVAVGAAAVFTVLTVAQAIALPARRPEPARGTVLQDWTEVLTDRRFLLFSLSCAGLFTLYNQFYLLLPLEAVRVTGRDWATGAVFGVSTTLTLLWQVRLTSAVGRRAGPGVAIAGGLGLMGVAFLPALLGASDAATAPGTPLLAALPAALPVLATTVLLTLGYDLAQPFANDLAAGFARPGLTGTYLGTFSMASGLAALLGNTVVGWLDDRAAELGQPWLPWCVLTMVGLASATGVTLMHRSGTLNTTEQSHCATQSVPHHR